MLKRKYARLSIVLDVLGIAILFIFRTSFGYAYDIVFLCIGTASIIAGMVISLIFVKCPSCGRRGTPPQWSKSGTRYCPFCGERFIYDDVV